MEIRLIVLFAGSMMMMECVKAQDSVKHWYDSLRVSVGTTSTVASEGFQPLWLVSNQFGTIADRQADISSDVYLFNEHTLFARKRDSTLRKHPMKVSYTFNLYHNNHLRDLTIVEGNAKVSWRGWQLRAGRYREVIGEVDSSLSTGSMAISGNAIPMPKISIAVPNYKNFPGTKGWVQFKGLFGHGWMGNERYYYSYHHEKTFFLRLGRGDFRLWGGVTHFTEWGGQRGNFSLDRSWKGFWDVVFVKEANDGSLPATSGARPNRAGDQRGTLEFGFDYARSYGDWHFYHQTFFESGAGIDIRNTDRLVGLSLGFREPKVVRKVLAEFIYTKQMENFHSEQQSYYNNGSYKTGWEYRDRIIGTPLFLNRVRGRFFLPVQPFNWHQDEGREGRITGNHNIISNRIIGGSIGAEYTIARRFAFKTILTYNQHFMDRSPLKREVNPTYRQFYSLQSVETRLNKKWTLLGRIAYDAGDFYHNFGASVGARYRIFN